MTSIWSSPNPALRAPSLKPDGLSIRAPQVATITNLGVSTSTPMLSEWDAETAVRIAYLQNVYVYRCVQVIATAVASLPFRAGNDPETPGEFNVNAPLAQLLGPPPGGPNPASSARRLWAWTVAQRLVTGRWAWEVETGGGRGGGAVRALWPLVSSLIDPIPSNGGDDYFDGYMYGRNQMTRRFLTPDQVVYRWNPSLKDFRQPESVLQAARLNVSVAIMQDRYDAAFLQNDARPAAVIVHQEFAEKSERDAFRDQFQASHGGPMNAGKPVFVEATEGPEDVSKTFHIETLGLNQRDAEFIARYDREIQAICVAFGTPISMLGDSSKRTFDNASQEAANWWEGTILPLLSDLQDDINISLAPRLGREVGWFDLTGVKALQEANFIAVLGPSNMVALVGAGVLLPDEIRGEVGLDPLPYGLGEAVDPAVQAAEDAQAQADALALAEANSGPDQSAPQPPALAAAAAARLGEKRNVERAQRHAVEYRTIDAAVRALEKSWQRQLARMFVDQGKDAVRKLRSRARRLQRLVKSYEGRADLPPAYTLPEAVAEVNAIFDKEEAQQVVEDVISSLYEDVVSLAGSRITARYGGVFNTEAPWVQQFISSRANQLAGGVTNTTYRAIQRVLGQGVHAGDSVDQLAARVQDVFTTASSSRARTIARTEVISAYNGSTYQTAAEAPRLAIAGLEWLATPGHRTRPAHSAASGQVIETGGLFSVGGEQLRYPGDPAGRPGNVINCRCTIAPLTPADMESRSSEPRALVPHDRARDLLTRLALGQLDAEAATIELYEKRSA